MNNSIAISKIGKTEDNKNVYGGTISFQIKPEQIDEGIEYNFCVKAENTNELKYITGSGNAVNEVAWFQLNNQGLKAEKPVVELKYDYLAVDWLDPENNNDQFASAQIRFEVTTPSENNLSFVWEHLVGLEWTPISNSEQFSIDSTTKFLRVFNTDPEITEIKTIRLRVTNTLTSGDIVTKTSTTTEYIQATLRAKANTYIPKVSLTAPSSVKIPFEDSYINAEITASVLDARNAVYQFQKLVDDEWEDIENANGNVVNGFAVLHTHFTVEDLSGAEHPYAQNSVSYRVSVTNSELNKLPVTRFSSPISINILPVDALEPTKVSLDIRHHGPNGDPFSGAIFQNGVTDGYDVTLKIQPHDEGELKFFLRYQKLEDGEWETLQDYSISDDPESWSPGSTIADTVDGYKTFRVKIDDSAPGNFRYIVWTVNTIENGTGIRTVSMPSPLTTDDDQLWNYRCVMVQQFPYVNAVPSLGTNVTLGDNFYVEFRYRNLTGPLQMKRTVNWKDSTSDEYILTNLEEGRTDDYKFYIYTETSFSDTTGKQIKSIVYSISEPLVDRSSTVVPYIAVNFEAEVGAPIQSLVSEVGKNIRNLQVFQQGSAYFRVEGSDNGVDFAVQGIYDNQWGRQNRDIEYNDLNILMGLNNRFLRAVASNGREERIQENVVEIVPFAVGANFNGDDNATIEQRVAISNVTQQGGWLYGNLSTNLVNLGNPSKTGFGFLGWFDKQEGSINVAKIESGTILTSNPSHSSAELYAPLTMYARWGANVTFDANGGQNSDSDVRTSIVIAVGLDGKYYKSNPYRPGYNFNGWFTAASGGTQVNFSTATFFAPTTLYAQWTRQVVIPSLSVNLEVDQTQLYFTTPSEPINLSVAGVNAFNLNLTRTTAALSRGVRFAGPNNEFRLASGTITSPSGAVTNFNNALILNAQTYTGIFNATGNWKITFTSIVQYTGGPPETINSITIGY